MPRMRSCRLSAENSFRICVCVRFKCRDAGRRNPCVHASALDKSGHHAVDPDGCRTDYSFPARATARQPGEVDEAGL